MWHNRASWLSTSIGDAMSQSSQNEHLLLAVLLTVCRKSCAIEIKEQTTGN